MIIKGSGGKIWMLVLIERNFIVSKSTNSNSKSANQLIQNQLNP